MTHTLLILFLLVFQAQEPAQSKSAKEFLDSGLVRLQEKDIDGGIADMTKAIELNPRYVEAFFIRGQCLFLKGDRDRALLDYDKVIELAPNARGVERVYNNRSVIRISKGDIEGAVQDLEKALEVNPNYADSFSNRGLTRFMRGDSAGAASDYDKALELDPKSPATYINRGILRFDRKNFEGAMADFNKAIELAPNAAKVYVDRAVLQILAGEIDLAVADLKKAVTLDATSISDKDPGIMTSPFKRLQSFISSNPTNARAYEARGLLRLAQGRRSEATQDFTKCLELDPKLKSEIDRLTKISWNGDQAKTQKLTSGAQARLLEGTRDGDGLLNILYKLSLEMQGSFNPSEDNFAIRVCSNDPLPLALPLASGSPFLTTIKLEKAGVPKSRIYYLRQNKNCSLAANGYAPTEYWLIPKGAEFPDHVEKRSASNLLGHQFTHHDQIEKGDRYEIDEIQNLTPRSYAEVLNKVVTQLKEHKNAIAVVQVFYYTRSRSAELNKRVTETQRYLTSNGVAQNRIHTKRMYWGPYSSAPEKYPNIFIVIDN